MTKNKKVLIAKMACILSVVPALIYAHEYGPDPGFTSAPGDNPTSCINSGCHVGKLNQYTGSVTVTAASGSNYVPGQTQVLTVTISDPAQKGAGYEITARLVSNLKSFSSYLSGFEPKRGRQTLPEPVSASVRSAELEWLEREQEQLRILFLQVKLAGTRGGCGRCDVLCFRERVFEWNDGPKFGTHLYRHAYVIGGISRWAETHHHQFRRCGERRHQSGKRNRSEYLHHNFRHQPRDDDPSVGRD